MYTHVVVYNLNCEMLLLQMTCNWTVSFRKKKIPHCSLILEKKLKDTLDIKSFILYENCSIANMFVVKNILLQIIYNYTCIKILYNKIQFIKLL